MGAKSGNLRPNVMLLRRYLMDHSLRLRLRQVPHASRVRRRSAFLPPPRLLQTLQQMGMAQPNLPLTRHQRLEPHLLHPRLPPPHAHPLPPRTRPKHSSADSPLNRTDNIKGVRTGLYYDQEDSEGEAATGVIDGKGRVE